MIPNPRFEEIELFVDAYVPPDNNEDDGMYQFMDNYDKWDDLPNTAGVDDTGSSHTFTQTIQAILQMSLSSQIFGLANVNHKYGRFETNHYTI